MKHGQQYGRSAEMKAWTQEQKAIRKEQKALDKEVKEIEKAEVKAAKKAISQMQRSLKGYLASRKRVEDIVKGKIKSTKYPPALAAKMVSIDMAGEQRLATQLFNLLSTYMDASQLPVADVKRNPMAAPQLAKVALGKQVDQVSAPQAQGILPIAPMLVLGVGALWYLNSAKKAELEAEIQKHKLDIECKKAGYCPDYGPWIIAASAVVLGWFAWDKLGIREKVQKKA